MARLSLRPRPQKRAVSPLPSDLSDSEEDFSDQDRAIKMRKKAAKKSGPKEAWAGEDGEGGGVGAVVGNAWQAHEDKVLLDAIDQHGCRWTMVVKVMRAAGLGRTQAMCRNRYQRMKAPSKTGKEGKNVKGGAGDFEKGFTRRGANK